MNKTLKVLLAAVVLGIGTAMTSQAAGSNRGAKQASALNYTTTVSTIAAGPAVLYAVIMSTVTTTGDFLVIWDSGSATGLAVGGPYTLMKAKITGSTTAQATSPSGNPITFDPPLQFNNGIAAVLSAVTNTATFVFEKGRGAGD